MFAVNAGGIVAAGQVGAPVVERRGTGSLVAAGLSLQSSGPLLLVGAVAGGADAWAVAVGFSLVAAAVSLVLPNASALALPDHPDRR